MAKLLNINTSLLLLFWFWNNDVQSQTFYTPDPSQTAGPVSGKINIMILSDGYLINEESIFETDVLDFYREFVITTPFQEYLSYFNIYGSFVVSTNRGPSHPVNGAICEPIPPSPAATNEGHSTSFGSSLDNFGLHRGLISDYSDVTTYLTNSIFQNQIIFPLVFVNTDQYSGAANIELGIATATARYSFNIVPGLYNMYYDERIAIHELGHSFGKLQDEYYFPCPYDSETCSQFDIAPNRSSVSEISNTSHTWHHWEGVSSSPTINSYSHYTIPQCPNSTDFWPNGGTTESSANYGNITYVDLVPDLYKPTTNHVCYMEKVTRPFCAVCREALIERIHDLTSPINSITPADLEGTYEASSSLFFDLDLTTPNPNTIRVKWELVNSVGDELHLETDYNNATDENGNVGGGSNGDGGGAPGGFYRWHLDCETFNEEGFTSPGDYTVRARIFDMTANTEGDNARWVRHPQHEIDVDDETNGNHEEIREWTVHYGGISGTDLYAEDNANDGGLELDEGSDLDLWLSPDLWLCNDDNTGCSASGDGPSYTGAGSQAQVNLLVKNRGCKVFDAGQDNGTVKFWWSKAKTLLEWPEDWDGGEIEIGSGVLVGDEIDENPVTITEDIDITNTNGVVVVSTLWDIPDPDSYLGLGLGLYDDNDITHFCFLALINSNNDPAEMIEEGDYRLYGSVLQSNNIVWRNVEIIDESSFTGGGSGQTTATDVIRGGGVIVSNNDSIGHTYKLKFQVPSTETGKPITEEAEVRVILSDSLWSKWMQGGEQGNDIAIYDSTLHQILLEDTLSYISGLSLDSNTNLGMFVSFNFLTRERTSKELFTLHVTQILDDSTQRVLGGETYVIKPDPNRAYFTADAGDDKEVIIGNAYSQTAKAITDSAIYNWYNSSGVRLHTGITFSDSATTTSTETYKLEVIAKSDGYKDYDEVTISTKLGKLTSIVPNPISTGTLAIGYLVASSVSTPKIRIVNISTSAYTEHSISTGSGTLNVDISPYTTGSYSIILICDSTTADDELLVVQ